MDKPIFSEEERKALKVSQDLLFSLYETKANFVQQSLVSFGVLIIIVPLIIVLLYGKLV